MGLGQLLVGRRLAIRDFLELVPDLQAERRAHKTVWEREYLPLACQILRELARREVRHLARRLLALPLRDDVDGDDRALFLHDAEEAERAGVDADMLNLFHKYHLTPILADRAAVFYEKAHQTHRTHKKEIPQI